MEGAQPSSSFLAGTGAPVRTKSIMGEAAVLDEPSGQRTSFNESANERVSTFMPGERSGRKRSVGGFGAHAVSEAFRRRMEFFNSSAWQDELMTDEELARRRWLVLPDSAGKIAWDCCWRW